MVVLLFGGCGSSDKDKATGPTPPVEVLYNNGLDALNTRRYASADDQFNSPAWVADHILALAFGGDDPGQVTVRGGEQPVRWGR